MRTIGTIVGDREPYWVSADWTVKKVVGYLCERKIGAVTVKEGDQVAGVFSERDLLFRVVGKGDDPA